MIATRSGAYEGIGFALPMNMAVKVYNSIISNGKVTRGYIGIRWSRDQKPDTLRAMGLRAGVFVESVTPGGPAEKAGLKDNDVIVALNGHEVSDGNDLVNRVADLDIGTTAAVTVDRDGKKLNFKLTIGDREKGLLADNNGVSPDPTEKEETTPTPSNPAVKFGIRLKDLTSDEAKTLPTTEKKGVRVAHVEEGSFAEDIGLLDNDIIIWLNRQPVATFEDVKKIQAALKPGDAVAFTIVRPSTGRAGNVEYTRRTFSGTLPAQ
jgi:serine protease Do